MSNINFNFSANGNRVYKRYFLSCLAEQLHKSDTKEFYLDLALESIIKRIEQLEKLVSSLAYLPYKEEGLMEEEIKKAKENDL